MMKVARRSVMLAGAMLPFAPAAAAPTPVDPATVVAAFNDTCRRGFPDLDQVATVAAGAGWIERKVTVPSDSSLKGKTATMPRFFAREPLMLILSRPGDLKGAKLGCEVATSVDSPGTTEAVAAAVATATPFGAPEMISRKGEQVARWRRSPTIVVEGSATRYNRMHSIIMHVFEEPENAPR
jgi:hypothetical protein